MLLALSPPEKLGEFFGVYVLTDKLSAVVGPAIVGGVLTVLGEHGDLSYRVAIGSLTPIMVVGLFLLLRVPDARPDPDTGEFIPQGTPGVSR